MTNHISLCKLDKHHRGWARAPFGGAVSHYIVGSKEFDNLRPGVKHKALCGHEFCTSEQVPLLRQGNWPSCKRCDSERIKLGLEAREL